MNNQELSNNAASESRPNQTSIDNTLFNQGVLNMEEFSRRFLYWTEELNKACFIHQVERPASALGLLAKVFDRDIKGRKT